MTDNLLADFLIASTMLSGSYHSQVSAYRKFTQDNANYLRANSNWCLQLAIIEPFDSPVAKEARQCALDSSCCCLVPAHEDTSYAATYEMRFSEHKKSVGAMAFDPVRGYLISSDGEEIIRWDAGSGAINSRFRFPKQEAVARNAFYKSDRVKVVFSEKAQFMVAGNMLADLDSGKEITNFISQRNYEEEYSAPSAIADSSLFAVCTNKKHIFNEAGSGHTVTIIAGTTGKVVCDLPHTGVITNAMFSPDSNMIVTSQLSPGYDQGEAKGNDRLIVWDVKTVAIIQEFNFGAYAHSSFSPDGKLLIAVNNNHINCWETGNWSLLFNIWESAENKKGVLYVDETHILTWGDLSVTLWDTPTQHIAGRITFDNSRKLIYSVVLTHNRTKLVIGFGNGLIEMWSLDEMRNLKSAKEFVHSNDLIKVATRLLFAPDGKHIGISYSKDLITLVDAEKNIEIASRKLFEEQENPEPFQPKDYLTNNIEAFNYTPDGKSLILILLSSKPDKKSPPTPFGYKSLSFGSVRRISAIDLTDQAIFEYKDFFQFESCLTPDGYCVFARFVRDKLIQLRTSDLSVVKEHNKDIRLHWALSPDGSKLVFTNSVWSFAENRSSYNSHESAPFFENPIFSPDGTLIAFQKNQKIYILNIRNNYELIILDFVFKGAMNVGEPTKKDFLFSPDGRKLLLIEAQKLSVLDIRNRNIIVLEKHNTGSTSISCRFSADSLHVYEVEKDFISVWNASSGKLLALLPMKSIDASDWNADGTLLAVAKGSDLRFFHLHNIVRKVPIVTATYFHQFNPKNNQQDLTADCPHCGHRFEVPSSIPEIIAKLNTEHGIGATDSPCLKLPDKAWDEPGLVSGCPHCMNKIRFNPFIAGNENHKPKWKFW